MGARYAAPDGFYQAPLTVTGKFAVPKWETPVFAEPTEMIGTGAAHPSRLALPFTTRSPEA
ncbi:hypothetical protein ACWDTG_01455 [Rhodococcus zopfii]